MNEQIDTQKKIWFKRKSFGWGWQPSSWQGWGVLTLYLLGILSDALFEKSHLSQDIGDVLQFLVHVFVLTAFLIIICYKTGEKPEWRWGVFSRKQKITSDVRDDGSQEN